MILWAILTLMICVNVAGLTVPLVRRYDRAAARAGNIAILRDQIAEIDSQEQAGSLTAADAEGMRAEIKRRILAEGRVAEAPSRPLNPNLLPWTAIAVAAIMALAAVGLYALIGHSTPVAAPVAASAPADQSMTAQAGGAPQHPVADVTTMIGRLEAKMKETPGDAEGWRMLGWSYLSVGRAQDAAQAYGRAAALAPGRAEYLSAEGDALVQAANGQVTGAALAAFQAALKADPQDARARYFLALDEDQKGQHDRAMEDWIALLKSAPPGAAWVQEVRDFVARVAAERHVDLAGRLPPAPAAPDATPAAPGPSADQVAAAQQMSDDDRKMMIHAMVDRLAGDLKTNPRNQEGWQRLMRARMVLGETQGAVTAYRDAQRAFAGSPAELASLRDAARALGLPGA